MGLRKGCFFESLNLIIPHLAELLTFAVTGGA